MCFSELGSEEAAKDIAALFDLGMDEFGVDDDDDDDETFIEKGVFKVPKDPPSSVSV